MPTTETAAPAGYTELPGVPRTSADAWLAAANVKDKVAAANSIGFLARAAANRLNEQRVSHVDITPGNGYAYEIVLITQPQTDGEVIVALPEFGRAARISVIGSVDPIYVGERLNFGHRSDTPHTAVLALFLTEVGHHLHP